MILPEKDFGKQLSRLHVEEFIEKGINTRILKDFLSSTILALLFCQVSTTSFPELFLEMR